MKEAEKDYRIWKNKNFVIESTITVKLWDEILINDFHEKLNKVLDEIYERIDLFSNNSKNLISISAPLGKALINKTINDVIEVKTPGGLKEYQINSIKYS